MILTFVFVLFLFIIIHVGADSDYWIDLNEIPETLPFAIFHIGNERIPRKRRTSLFMVQKAFHVEFIPRKKRTIFEMQSVPNSSCRSRCLQIQRMDNPPVSNSASSFCSSPYNLCRLCNVYFRKEWDFEKHFKEEHEDRAPYVCDICRPHPNFRKRLTLLRHAEKKHKEMMKFMRIREKRDQLIKCEICNDKREYRGMVAFERHAVSKHQGVPLISCPFCEKKFKRKRTQSRHAAIIHGRVAVLRCNFCKMNFDRSDKKDSHETRCKIKHTATVELKRKQSVVACTYCTMCKMQFGTYTEYRDHCRFQHPGAKVYSCEHCPKSFSNPRNLDNHINFRHTDVRPLQKYRRNYVYRCDFCREDFIGLIKFQGHAFEKHPGRRMFRCGNCGIRFMRKNALDHHLKRKHPRE